MTTTGITMHRLLAILLLLISLCGAIAAQTPARTEQPPDTQPSNEHISVPTVTATAAPDRVRYVSIGEVRETRLQVFSATGTQIYDSGLRLGNLVEWRLTDEQGASHADGSYLFLITVRDFSDRLTQKYGTAILEQAQVYLEQTAFNELHQPLAAALAANQQAATLSPIDRIGATGLNRTATTATGEETSVPAASTPSTPGTPETTEVGGGEDLGGTGSQNKVAKWVDNSANLGDSIIFDNGSGVGVGTTDLTDVLVAGNDKFKVVDGPMTFSFRDFASGQGYFAIGSTNGIKGFIGHTNTADGFTLGTFSNHKLTIRTNSVNRLIIDTSGNVGIGLAVPTSKLDVAGVINTSEYYNIDGRRVLSTSSLSGQSICAGIDTQAGCNGPVNNAVFGHKAGEVTTSSGDNNSFFGAYAANANTGGSLNAFFGTEAGRHNTDAGNNSFFGAQAGKSNTTGENNAFFGTQTGHFNHLGNENSFFGYRAGFQNLVNGNSFFGYEAGHENDLGLRNAFFGFSAGHNNTGGNDNTYLGYVAGDNSTGSDNTFVGADAGGSNNSGFSNTFVGSDAGDANETGSNNTIIGRDADVNFPSLTFATAIGAGSRVSTNNTVVLGRASDIVFVPGTLSKAAGSFKIDHPLDPTNKYLYHSFVESPDMMNVYNGNVRTDARGLAVVILPDYFEALNRDFRYQLTVIGKFAQAIVLKKIEGNRFLIKTSKPRVEVSWQVTGIRRDAYAETNRIPTVELKPEAERGTYLHPEAFRQKSAAGKKAGTNNY